jgi:transposase-like protein
MRRHYREEERDELVEEVAEGRATIAEAADKRGVARSTAYQWMRDSRTSTPRARAGGRKQRAPRGATFVELVPRMQVGAAIAVRVRGAEIEVRPGFDVELLRAVIVALTGEPT